MRVERGVWLSTCVLLGMVGGCAADTTEPRSGSNTAKRTKSDTATSAKSEDRSSESATKPSSPAESGGAGSAEAAKPAAGDGKYTADPQLHGTGGMPKPPAMDECGLKTRFPGDAYCILPPPPDQGFQLHIGPRDYNNPEAKYVLGAGQEITNDFQTVSGNDKPIHFYYRQFRMRPGAHHNIVSSTAGGGFGMGRRIGTSNHLAEDSPKDGIIAPENAGVGIAMAAKQTINVSLHSINTTDTPMLREVWINFWYRPDDEVTEEVEELFQVGDAGFAIQPREETVLGPYRCTIRGDGRMLWFYGHRHANNLRFSAWRVRGAERELFYEGLNWEEPIVLEYSSTVENTMPQREKGIEGGWSGVLDMNAGDVLEWECHVKNKTDQVLRFANETYTAEMCIMDAELVGANCQSSLFGR